MQCPQWPRGRGEREEREQEPKEQREESRERKERDERRVTLSGILLPPLTPWSAVTSTLAPESSSREERAEEEKPANTTWMGVTYVVHRNLDTSMYYLYSKL